MEEGSLVQEALDRMQQQRQSNQVLLQNTLVIDVFLNKSRTDNSHSKDKDTREHENRFELFSALARLATRLNSYIHRRQFKVYPWHCGGDGPVFGVHATDNQAHLRATCQYGENIQDEWFAVAIMMLFSQEEPEVAVQCWDLDDGHLLLIESAHVLPPWVEQINTSTSANMSNDDIIGENMDACRHVCWIRDGKVLLVKPQTLQLPHQHQHIGRQEALTVLANSPNNRVIESEQIQQAIHKRVGRFVQNTDQESESRLQLELHRAAFVLPHSVACLMQKRPDLVSCAILAYCRNHEDIASNTSTSNTSINSTCKKHPPEKGVPSIDFENLVWTTHTLTRTSYAMLRTMEREEQSKSTKYKSIEVNRMKRVCRMEATPHLKYALKNGMCLTTGFECILSASSSSTSSLSSSSSQAALTNRKDAPSGNESRIMSHWARIDMECGIKNDGISEQWLRKAWIDGPNTAQHDLTDLIQCPVYDPEIVSSLCPLSHPGKNLKEQVKFELDNATASSKKMFSGSCPEFEKLPRNQDVDSEAWLELESFEAMDDLMMEVTTTIESSDSIANDTAMQRLQMKPKPANENETNVSDDPANIEQSTRRYKSTDKSDADTEPQIESLTSMLDSFQTFVSTKSEFEGVSNAKRGNDEGKNGASKNHDSEKVVINPRIFLNILQTVIKCSPEEIASINSSANEQDQYFSKEDYDLMEETSSSDDDLSIDGSEDNGSSMQSLMRAMDDELQGTNVTMKMDLPGGGLEHDGRADDIVAQDSHILSNLLESLDATGGAPGPVRNILKGMGADFPDILPTI